MKEPQPSGITIVELFEGENRNVKPNQPKPKFEFVRLHKGLVWHLVNPSADHLACDNPNARTLAAVIEAVTYSDEPPKPLCSACRRLYRANLDDLGMALD
jgi:hypothetical protein